MAQDTALLDDATDPTRSGRATCLSFTTDGATDHAIREGLEDYMPGGVENRRGGIRAALTVMQKVPTPRVLIVDLSGEASPLALLEELSLIVEPTVCILAIGDNSTQEFYRDVTRHGGASEYLPKPATRELVARHFGPFVQGRAPTGEAALGGRLITVTGSRGGVGASTIAVNLAYYFGVTSNRHAILLDSDLYFGTGAFLLNLTPGRALGHALRSATALEPQHSDKIIQRASERLHLLSAQEPLTEDHVADAEAAERLINTLRRRYFVVVADAPFRSMPLNQELLQRAHRRVLVMEPTLASVRDTLRLLAMRAGPDQAQRPILVLNRANRPGGLTRRQLEDTLKAKVDVTIPNLPKQIGQAATLGMPAASRPGPFQAAIQTLGGMLASEHMLTAGPIEAAKKPGLLSRLFSR